MSLMRNRKPKATALIPDAKTRKAAREAFCDVMREELYHTEHYNMAMSDAAQRHNIPLETLKLYATTGEADRISDMYAQASFS
jgi:hypothetical protein